MKLRFAGLVAILGCAALAMAIPAMGQYYGDYTGESVQPLVDGGTVTVQYTGGYETAFAGEGAGIYSGKVNGFDSGMICDDFNDHINSGDLWNAKSYQASNLTAANIGETLFGSTIGLGGYAEVATLVQMMFNGGSTFGSITGITHGELSAAIWDITTPGGIDISSDAKVGALVAALEALISGKSAADLAAYMKQFTSLWVLTPVPGQTGVTPQEMWVQAPEGGAALLYLLLAGLACFGAMAFTSRKEVEFRELA